MPGVPECHARMPGVPFWRSCVPFWRSCVAFHLWRSCVAFWRSCKVLAGSFFDTIVVELNGATADDIIAAALAREINLRKVGPSAVGISLDETVTVADVAELVELFTGVAAVELASASEPPSALGEHGRTTSFMEQAVFNSYHSETDMMRYMKMLENKNLSLVHDMIPLGSCTMKLNSAVEMQAVTMPGFRFSHAKRSLDLLCVLAPESPLEEFSELR